MNKLEEEEVEHEEETPAADAVRMPAKGKDYVILPTSDQGADQGAEEKERKRRYRRNVAVIGGLSILLLLIVVITLCVVLLDKGSKEEEEKRKERIAAGRLSCSLAGLEPTEKECQAAGCDYYPSKKSSAMCLYKEENPYYVSESKVLNGTIQLQLTRRNDHAVKRRRRRQSEEEMDDDEEEIALLQGSDNDNSTDPLPKQLFVSITYTSPSSLRLQVNANKQDTSASPVAEPLFNLETAEVGYPFFFSLTRKTSGEVLFNSTSLPLILTTNLAEISAVTTDKVFSNGKTISLKAESFPIWASAENSNLPYYYGIDSGSESFGVALGNTGPAKMSFSKTKEGKTLVSYVLLDGEVDLHLFTGPTPTELAAQFSQVFDKAYMPPSWSLGTIVKHDPTSPVDAESFPIDTLLLDSIIDDPHSTQTISHRISTLDPRKQLYSDPGIRNSEGDEIRGMLEASSGPLEMMGPGSLVAYVDYSAAPKYFTSDDTTVYGREAPGYNLVLNYPTNYVEDKERCEENEVNVSPYVNILDKPLYQGTLCLDSIHTQGIHKKLHNTYGTLQAKVLHTFRESAGQTPIWQTSESVSLGAGKYTAKTLPVSTVEELKQVVPLAIWYGMVGIHVTPQLHESANDTKLTENFHKLSSFLPFTTGDEAALSKLENHDSILSFLTQKYLFYPEWLSALYKGSMSGEPVIRSMDYNYPNDTFVKSSDFHDSFHQYMLGDKVIVAYGSLVGGEMKAYLPQGDRWYMREAKYAEHDFDLVTPFQSGVMTVTDPIPERFYFVKEGQVLMLSKQYDAFEIKTGNKITTTKTRPMRAYILLKGAGTSIQETYYFDGGEKSLTVEFNVTVTEGGIRLEIKPSNSLHEESRLDSIWFYGVQGSTSLIRQDDEDMEDFDWIEDEDRYSVRLLKIAHFGTETDLCLTETHTFDISYRQQ